MKKLLSLTLSLAMALSLAACGGGGGNNATSSTPSTGGSTTGSDAGTPSAGGSTAVVTINVGYENATTEPAAQACEKWKELVAERSNGTLNLELFPNSALGAKNDLIDQMLMGENVITVADGAFLAEYGVKDFGFFYAPYAFDTWDELWNVLESDWYADLCDQLAATGGIRVLSSNWIYGARDILSIKPVHTPADLAGMKMRVSSNDLSITSFSDLGATPLGMDMGDVYQAMSGSTIDAVENPISSLYNRSFHEVAKYLCKNEHILATSMWICGESFFSTLTPEQQQILMECADEAGLVNNGLYDEVTAAAEQGMRDAGVEIYELTDADKQAWIDAAQKFFANATETMGWSEGLYETVKALGAK